MDADGDICQHEHTNSKKRPTIWTHLAAHPHEAHKQHGHRKHDRQAGSKTNLFEKTVADFWALPVLGVVRAASKLKPFMGRTFS